MNSDGLALADTRIGWRRPGVGWLRYLLMNEILIRAATVAEALAFIESQPHAGGGALVLMDAAGHAAAIELGVGSVHVTQASDAGIGRTNHFLNPDLRTGQTRWPNDPNVLNSRGRLARIENWIEDSKPEQPALEGVAALFASHDGEDHPALCRHGGAEGSETISASVFACASRRLYFCPGNPCADDWRLFAF
jgi:predicted choloylglycine hydrolase